MYQTIISGKINLQGNSWLDMDLCTNTKVVGINSENCACIEAINTNLLNRFEFGNAYC